MIFSILFYCFLGYLLYRIIFNFVLPIYRTTRQVKRSFREMQERMNEQMHKGRGYDHAYNNNTHTNNNTQTGKQDQSQLGEYIDFEEIKD